MTVKLTADDLRNIATFIDGLNASTKQTGVQACAYDNDAITMPHWPHALYLERAAAPRWPDDPAAPEVYQLIVGSDR